MERARRLVSIGRGVVVPYPIPTSSAASKVARGNRRRDTGPELALRSELHRRGLRYRTDFLVNCRGGLKTRPDVAFTRVLVAVFVDGCFWHGCPDHGITPGRNPTYWIPKLKANAERDRRVDVALRGDGWHVERVWEHEDPHVAADRIAAAVRTRRNMAIS